MSEFWIFYFCLKSGLLWLLSLGIFLKFYWCVLGDQHQQDKVDSEIYVSTKGRRQQSPGSKVDSEIFVSTKDHEQQLPSSKVDSKIYVSTKDRQQQSPGSKVDSEICVSTEDHEQQSPGSKVDSDRPVLKLFLKFMIQRRTISSSSRSVQWLI